MIKHFDLMSIEHRLLANRHQQDDEKLAFQHPAR